MPQLRTFSARDLRALLAKHGFAEVRQKGSHVVLQRISDGRTTTVIVPDHKEIRIGTLQSIIRQSGLQRAIFEVTN
jgi:predicted RNA binding protein YcfA (HicA-like mRNA interferase family)